MKDLFATGAICLDTTNSISSFFMLLLDLDEIPQVLNRTFWSTRRWHLCRFKQEDHLRRYLPSGDRQDSSLQQRVIAALRDLGVHRPIGPIRLLTQLSYLGFSMNPVSFFYCYSPEGDQLEAIIAEVNNTPWGEQHLYLVDAVNTDADSVVRSGNIQKDFHVSPFMTLDMDYRMALTPPGEKLAVKIENHLHPTAKEATDWTDTGSQRSGSTGPTADKPLSRKNKIIDVTMSLQRKPMTAANLNWLLVKYPAISFSGVCWNLLASIDVVFEEDSFRAAPGQGFQTKARDDSPARRLISKPAGW